MAISDKKAVEAIKILTEYCAEQRGCQNCILHLHRPSDWDCHLDVFDLRDILSNIEAKWKHRGYLQ